MAGSAWGSRWIEPRLKDPSRTARVEARIQASLALLFLAVTIVAAPSFIAVFGPGRFAPFITAGAVVGYAASYGLIMRGHRHSGSVLLVVTAAATVWSAVWPQVGATNYGAMASLTLLPLALAAALGFHGWCWILGGVNVVLFGVLGWPFQEGGLLSGILALSSLLLAALLGTAGRVRDAERDHLRQTEASLHVTNARQKVLMDNLEELVWTIDGNGVIQAINRPAQQMFQAAFGSTIGPGDAWLDVVPKHLLDKAKESWNRAFRGEAFTVHRTFEIQGVSRVIDIRYVPLRDATGTITGVLCSAADRTDAAARARLEEAKDTLAAEMENLQQEQRQHLRAWSAATHELKNPLTPLLVRLRMLRRSLGDDITAAQAKNLDVLERSAHRLTALATDILDMARAQNQALKIEAKPVDLGGLLEAEVEAAQGSAQEAGVAVECDVDGPLEALADDGRIGQVVQNLLANAIKFTPEGKTIRVTAQRDGDEARIDVTDEGIGISEEGLALLFRPFSQVHDPSATDVAGTGLGLYICKSIMEAHGGRIEATSAGDGKGSTFTLFLPLA